MHMMMELEKKKIIKFKPESHSQEDESTIENDRN